MPIRMPRPSRVSTFDYSDRHDDFAEMPVGAHIGQRVGGLIEWESLVDRQAQLAGGDGVPEVLAHQAVYRPNLLDRAGAEGDADIGDPLQRVQIEIELALETTEPADIDDAAEYRRGLHVLVHDACRYLVDDDVQTPAAGGAQRVIGP